LVEVRPLNIVFYTLEWRFFSSSSRVRHPTCPSPPAWHSLRFFPRCTPLCIRPFTPSVLFLNPTAGTRSLFAMRLNSFVSDSQTAFPPPSPNFPDPGKPGCNQPSLPQKDWAGHFCVPAKLRRYGFFSCVICLPTLSSWKSFSFFCFHFPHLACTTKASTLINLWR